MPFSTMLPTRPHPIFVSHEVAGNLVSECWSRLTFRPAYLPLVMMATRPTLRTIEHRVSDFTRVADLCRNYETHTSSCRWLAINCCRRSLRCNRLEFLEIRFTPERAARALHPKSVGRRGTDLQSPVRTPTDSNNRDSLASRFGCHGSHHSKQGSNT
jgi:hypothetical protein